MRVRKTTPDGKSSASVKETASASGGRTRRTRAGAPAQAPLAGALARDEIARRAYEIYERSGFRQGQDLDHWLIAERELQGF